MKEKKEIQYKKNNECIKILTYISKILKFIWINENINIKKTINTKINTKTNKIVECSIKINESLLMEGIYTNLLKNIINGNLTEDSLKLFMKIYIKLIKNENNRSFPRVSKIPFSKWYVKEYHKRSGSL